MLSNGNLIMLFLGNDNEEIVVNISFDKSKDLKIPLKMYIDSAGYDLFPDESITILKWSRASINTNIRFQIPKW